MNKFPSSPFVCFFISKRDASKSPPAAASGSKEYLQCFFNYFKLKTCSYEGGWLIFYMFLIQNFWHFLPWCQKIHLKIYYENLINQEILMRGETKVNFKNITSSIRHSRCKEKVVTAFRRYLINRMTDFVHFISLFSHTRRMRWERN